MCSSQTAPLAFTLLIPIAACLGQSQEPVGQQKHVPLVHQKSGLITVLATCGDKPLRLALDTGSAKSYLDPSRDVPKGFAWTHGKKPSRDSDQLININTKCDLEEIKLADATITNVRFLAIDLAQHNARLATHGDPPIDGLLGADLLVREQAVIDLKLMKLNLRSVPAK